MDCYLEEAYQDFLMLNSRKNETINIKQCSMIKLLTFKF